jgi:hypothetical protein
MEDASGIIEPQSRAGFRGFAVGSYYCPPKTAFWEIGILGRFVAGDDPDSRSKTIPTVQSLGRLRDSNAESSRPGLREEDQDRRLL